MDGDAQRALTAPWLPRPRDAAQPVPAPGTPGAVPDVRTGDARAAVLRVVAEPTLLELVAQPFVDLASGVPAGYELLSRVPAAWCVPPDVLFATARALGLSTPLAARALSEALRLRDELPHNTFLSVNVDPVDLPTPEILDLLTSTPTLARVVVEVTEHAWPDDREPIDAAIQLIRDRGGMIAADDVGAGYAGLNQLMRLRPDFVKIDKELVDQLGYDPASEALITAVGQLCGSLNAWVIVEGVETEVQLAALARLGVPLAQGWLFGKPAAPWPEPSHGHLVRERYAMARLDGALASLLRPVGDVYTRDEHGQYWRAGQAAPSLTLAPSTELKEAVVRALSRPPQQRWTPVLATGETGLPLGEVTMEDLVAAAVQ